MDQACDKEYFRNLYVRIVSLKLFLHSLEKWENLAFLVRMFP